MTTWFIPSYRPWTSQIDEAGVQDKPISLYKFRTIIYPEGPHMNRNRCLKKDIIIEWLRMFRGLIRTLSKGKRNLFNDSTGLTLLLKKSGLLLSLRYEEYSREKWTLRTLRTLDRSISGWNWIKIFTILNLSSVGWRGQGGRGKWVRSERDGEGRKIKGGE